MSHNTESIFKAEAARAGEEMPAFRDHWAKERVLRRQIAHNQRQLDQYVESRREVLAADEHRLTGADAAYQRLAGEAHERALREVLRDQSEDRPSPRFIVAYVDNEDGPFRDWPWKVYDLRRNPQMRGEVGRWSFPSAKAATRFAVKQEAKYA